MVSEHAPADASASKEFNPNDLTDDDLSTARPLSLLAQAQATAAAKAQDPDPVVPASTPAPAPAPVQEAKPEPKAQPAPVVDEPTPVDPKAAAIAAAKANRSKFGTKVVAAVGVALALFGVWKMFAPTPASASTGTTVGTSQQAAVAPPSSVVDADIVAARAYLTEHGTLEGIVLDGAQLAVRGTTMYAARLINGACTVYGILDGRDLAPTTDTTGAACTGQIVTVQAQLDQAAQQQAFDASQQAQHTLELATTAAQYYASRNFVGGTQSFNDLPGQIEGAAVAQNNGDWVLLRVSLPAFCMERIVTASEAGQFNECTA